MFSFRNFFFPLAGTISLGLSFAVAMPIDDTAAAEQCPPTGSNISCGEKLSERCQMGLLICTGANNLLNIPMGSCVQCGEDGAWYPKRMWSWEETMGYLLEDKLPNP